jgi:anti-sigma-K factor RskA
MNTPADGFDDLGGQEPPSDDLLAAEYVLGVLEAGSRLAAEARTASDPAFADRVSAWQRRFAPLALELRPVEVPSRVWTRIQERLGWSPAVSTAGPGTARSLYFWRLTAGIAAAAAVALLAVDLVPRWNAPTVSEAQLARSVTTLTRDDGTPGWLATVDPSRGTVLMVPVPSSLGAVSITQARTVEVPRVLRADLTSSALLAITLEPPAGIPHAAPTGPIIAKGPIQL